MIEFGAQRRHLTSFEVGKRGRKEVKQLLGQVHGALHNQPLTVAGYTVRFVRFEFGTTFKDADGVTYHGVQRYRIVVDDV